MGYISDYYITQNMDEEFNHFHHSNKISNMEYIWLSSNGKEYKVKDMTDNHIQNTLRCLEEGKISFDTDYELNLWINIMRKVCRQRGLKELKLRTNPDCDATESDIY